MSALDIEVGDHGLEVKATGTAILVIATVAFVGGFIVGFRVGLKFYRKDD